MGLLSLIRWISDVDFELIIVIHGLACLKLLLNINLLRLLGVQLQDLDLQPILF
jgi:hypothetical protein